MRKVLFLVLALALFETVAGAQQPPVDGYDAIGNVYSFAALDTVHSSFSKAATVAAAKWYGPRTIHLPKIPTGDPASRNGDWTTTKVLPTGWFLYANEPFTFKAIYVNGDSTGLAAVHVDTLSVTAIQAASSTGFRDEFPCRYHLKAAISQLRVNTASGDTVLAVPMYEVRE